jgi:hypothetical protein
LVRKKARVTHKKFCDHGHEATKVHRLDTGGGSGVFLCKQHWEREMRWRKQRNKTLSRGNKFAIRKWRA